MHISLILASLLIALGGSLLCLTLLRFTRSPHYRRAVQISGLLIPALVVGLLAAVTMHFLTHVCFVAAPPLDVLLTQIATVAGAVGILIATLLNAARAILLPIQLRKLTWDAPLWLSVKAAEMASQAGLSRGPRVRVSPDPRPWALVAGPGRPHLVVSTGLIALLDEEELGAVLLHELLHIRRKDLWWAALCGVLRDFTWFLPTTRILYSKMLLDQEIACDDGIVGEFRRLALASALVRVWQAQLALRGAVPRGALALFSPELPAHIERRVRRLLDNAAAAAGPTPQTGLLVIGSIAAVVMLFLFVQLAATTLAMQAMGCG